VAADLHGRCEHSGELGAGPGAPGRSWRHTATSIDGDRHGSPLTLVHAVNRQARDRARLPPTRTPTTKVPASVALRADIGPHGGCGRGEPPGLLLPRGVRAYLVSERSEGAWTVFDPGAGSDSGSRASWTQRQEDMPERLRGRARAGAAMLGSASGVVMAGVTFGAAAMSQLTRLLVGSAGSLFVIATALCITASLCNLGRGSIKRLPGTRKPPPEITELTDRIENWTKLGGWMAALGSLVLVAAVATSILRPTDTSLVTVRLISPADKTPADHSALQAACPGLSNVFRGEVANPDLMGIASFIPVKLAQGSCTGRTLYIPRSSVVNLITDPG